MLQVVLEIGDLHRAGEFVRDCPDYELIIGFVLAMGEGVNSINDVVAKPQFPKTVEIPAVAFLNDIVKERDGLLLDALDAISHSLTMADVRLTCLVRLPLMRFGRDLSGGLEFRSVS
ncbi:hypothetical protein ASC97_24315 [Rhizobium sp. Root1203]|nr:hypothetical protein ASC97_24315 [Rhizobium sp. Root1203]